jgi:hypothetical protein
MKKSLTLAAGLLLAASSNAQKIMHGMQVIKSAVVTAAKPTAMGDTVSMTNIAAGDTTRVLYAVSPDGSGYTAGMNAYNDRAFAERYDFDASDSTVNVVGVMTLFGGHVSASSAKNVTLKIWDMGGWRMITARLYYEGFPATTINSLSVPVTQLGIGATADTIKHFMFPAETGFLKGAFFAGYSIDYNFADAAGDTIALLASEDGSRTTPAYKLRYNTGSAGDTVTIDTMLYVQNATQWSDYVWHDNYTDNDSLYNHLAIFPIVTVGGPAGTGSVTHKGLTLRGAWPNPANGMAHIGIELNEQTDVTLTVTDMAGRVIRSSNFAHLASGSHTLDMPTDEMVNGNYLYLVRTATGSGMAGKLVVVQ